MISSLCKIFVNDIEISGNKFIPDKVGEYSVYVTYNTLKSEIKKFTVITSTSSEVKDFKINVLIEDITGAWCKHCPRVSYKLEQLKNKLNRWLSLQHIMGMLFNLQRFPKCQTFLD